MTHLGVHLLLKLQPIAGVGNLPDVVQAPLIGLNVLNRLQVGIHLALPLLVQEDVLLDIDPPSHRHYYTGCFNL